MMERFKNVYIYINIEVTLYLFSVPLVFLLGTVHMSEKKKNKCIVGQC